MLSVEVVDELAGAEHVAPEWDELAVLAGQPYSAPGWLLAWWRHVAPPGARLRLAVVRDGEALAGVAPLWTGRGASSKRWRLLGTGSSHRVTPLARPGVEAGVADALAADLGRSGAVPGRIEFESIPDTSPWPSLLADRWPGRSGRPAIRRRNVLPAPTLTLEAPSYEDWLAAKSGSFRRQARRVRRQLDGAGARFRLSAAGAEAARDLDALERLHLARWERRGGSGAMNEGVRAMLGDAAEALMPGGRMRLWMIELDGEPISAQLFVAAGGEVAYWLGGFDERRSEWQPALQAVLAAVEDAFERGDRRVDLGGGEAAYKRRLSDGEDTLADVALAPRSPAGLATSAGLVPGRTATGAKNLVPARIKNPLKRLIRHPLRRDSTSPPGNPKA